MLQSANVILQFYILFYFINCIFSVVEETTYGKDFDSFFKNLKRNCWEILRFIMQFGMGFNRSGADFLEGMILHGIFLRIIFVSDIMIKYSQWNLGFYK
jgi:hypothetical protein